MKQIKFSNEYDKMLYNEDGKRPKKAILMEIFVKNSQELHPRFVEYDTSYLASGQPCYYKLPKGDVIVLLLKSYTLDTLFLWTTIRRFTPEKLKYYKESRGEEFEIVFTPDSDLASSTLAKPSR